MIQLYIFNKYLLINYTNIIIPIFFQNIQKQFLRDFSVIKFNIK